MTDTLDAGVEVMLGVDIAQDTFTAAVWFGDEAKYLGQHANTATGFRELSVKLKKYDLTPRLVIEATAGYEWGVVRYALAEGWKVSFVNPTHVRHWIKGEGWRAKSDVLDAKRIAEYASKHDLFDWKPLSESLVELEALLSRRADLQKLIQQESNRQHAFGHRYSPSKTVDKSIAAVLKTVKTQLEVIEATLKQIIKQDQVLVTKAKILKAIPGVGPKLLPALLTLLMKWHAMTNGKGSDNALVSYVGLDSKTETSGRTVRGSRSISKKGDPEIRRLLYMGALGATTGNNVVRQIYCAKVAAGKPPLNALVACARRLLVWAWKLFQSEQAFDPSRILKTA